MPRLPDAPVPSSAFQTMARQLCGNPAAFAHLPDFDDLRKTAWDTLKAAQLARLEQRRPVRLRTIGPVDAA